MKKDLTSTVEPGPGPNSITIDNVTTTAPTKTVWFSSNSPTPEWALTLFRYYFWATTTISSVIAFLDTSMDIETKLTILKWVGVSNLVVHSFCKQFGIVVDNASKDKP